jgi:hypothetical protein
MKEKPMGRKQYGMFAIIEIKTNHVVMEVKALSYCDALNVFFGDGKMIPGYRAVRLT